MSKSKQKEENQKSCGKFEFEITAENEKRLKAILVYSKVFDLIVFGDYEKSPETTDKAPEHLNDDGVINFVLDDALTKYVKVLQNKHGFADAQEFTDVIGACESGEQVMDIIQRAEKRYYHDMYKGILSQIPLDDGQMQLPFDDEAKK